VVLSSGSSSSINIAVIVAVHVVVVGEEMLKVLSVCVDTISE